MDDRKIQPIPMNEQEKRELKTIARLRGGQSMASAARQVIHEKYLAIVTQPANGEEQVVGLADVTREKLEDGTEVITVDDASETNPTLKVGAHSEKNITHEPARAPVEAIAPTGKYAELIELKATYDNLLVEYDKAVAAGADDHTLQNLANEIGATSQELNALQAVEKTEG